MTHQRFFLSSLFLSAILFAFVSFPFFSAAQTQTLSLTEFVEIVKTYHPVVKQANLIPAQAREELRIARGGWDPKIYSDYNRKSYDGVNYYSYFENSVSIPTWYGVQVKAGYDVVYGDRVNTESKLPKDGLGYLGISVPLGKNLFIDKQRAALQQAKIFQEASQQQRIIILNDVLFDALKAYYDWSYAYNELLVFTEAVKVAELRNKATIQSAFFGDRPAIDTVESLTQLQSRQFQQNEAKLKWLTTTFELSNFLWLNDNTTRPVDTTIVPASLSSDFLLATIDLNKLQDLETQVRLAHPELLNYRFKLNQLNVERKLKIENLKPTLNANYNLISERFNFQSTAGLLFTNNYKFGVNFAMPLTFAQGRGELKLTKLKIQNTQLDLDYKTQQLINKIRTYYNELIILQQQTRLYEQQISALKKLFDGETNRFVNGESSLFLVNAREIAYLSAQVKLSELQAKYYKTEAALKWSAGQLGQ